MPASFDVIIAGLGAMGSAAAFHLARRGVRVLGLDRFTPPHAFGSSHGQTRIIREAYFEHPTYVPLVQRAYELWDALARAEGTPLFRQTGGLMIGPAADVLVRGALRSAETHRLKYELLNAREVRQRFPALRPAAEWVAVHEPRAGILFPEKCVAAHLRQARAAGATLKFGEPVARWEPAARGVRVFTATGEYEAGRLIVSAGGWVQTLLPDLPLPFTVERQVLFWFGALRHPAAFAPERLPIHLWEHEPGRFFYGFPDLGDGVKVAAHHEGEMASPDAINREVKPCEVAAMRALVRRFLPDADGPLRSTTVCLYTNTPDGHFLVDWHPRHPQVLVVSACAGHGFKFASVVGEVVADLVQQCAPKFDLGLFRWRF